MMNSRTNIGASALLFLLALSGCSVANRNVDVENGIVRLRVVDEDGRVLDDALVTLSWDETSIDVPFNALSNTFNIPADLFHSGGTSLVVVVDSLMFNQVAFNHRRFKSADADSEKQYTLVMHEPRTWVPMQYSGKYSYKAKPDPYTVFIGPESPDSFDLGAVKSGLDSCCGVSVLDAKSAETIAYILYLDTPLERYDSPVLKYLRMRSDIRKVGCVAEPDHKVPGDVVYYENSVCFSTTILGENVAGLQELMDRYGLKFNHTIASGVVCLEGPPGLGEGVIDIAQHLSEMSSVESVFVVTIVR